MAESGYFTFTCTLSLSSVSLSSRSSYFMPSKAGFVFFIPLSSFIPLLFLLSFSPPFFSFQNNNFNSGEGYFHQNQEAVGCFSLSSERKDHPVFFFFFFFFYLSPPFSHLHPLPPALLRLPQQKMPTKNGIFMS